MMMSYKPLKLDEVAENLRNWAEEDLDLMIISHRGPDGDTLGSAFALKLIYEEMGGYAEVTCKSEGAPYLRFLYSNQEEITYEDELELDFDRIITIDVASPSQLGDLYTLKDDIDMMIDHHARGEIFADYYVDGSASAAGEIVYKIYEYLKEKGAIGSIPQACSRMYAAISADTGSFKFSNTTPETHMIAAKLLMEMESEKIDHSEIARVLHDSYTEKDLLARKLAIENLKIECDGGFAYVVITNEMMKKDDLSDDNMGGLVDIPRSVEGVLVGISIKQSSDKEREFRISARSNSEIDVAAVCEKFGGGGHAKAAGGRIEADNCKTAVKIITEAFRAAVIKYQEANT